MKITFEADLSVRRDELLWMLNQRLLSLISTAETPTQKLLRRMDDEQFPHGVYLFFVGGDRS